MRSPFQFLDAYGRKDGDKFFGRDREITDLYEMVLKTPLVLVYGLSGTGKTSLVQCGLSKRFDRADWYPLFIRRGEDINLSLGERLMKLAPDDEALPAAVKAYRDGNQDVGDLSKELAKAVVNCLDNFYEEYLRPPYLLFDQFEETFILGDRREEEVFAHIVRAIVDSELPVKVLLIMREEYLGHLNHFERIVPSIYDYRFRVEEMDDRRIANVIVQSCRHFGITLEGLEDPASVKAFLHDQKRELPTPATVESIISNVRGDEEENTARKSISRIQLPYLQVYLDGLYRQVLANEAWQQIGLEYASRFPKTPPKEVLVWLQDMDTLETAARPEGALTAESKAFCLEKLENEGILSRNKEGQLVRANYPPLTFTNAEVNALGDIEEVLAGFLNTQLDHIREQLVDDYQEQKISAEVLTLVSEQLGQATIRASQIQLPGLISHDQFEACLEILADARMLAREGEGLYRPLASRDKLSKQAANLQEKLAERFAAGAQPAVDAFLNNFVTLEGTKKPLPKADISNARLSDQQIERCLAQLESARILRRSDDYYEVAHDALAKRIADKRSQDQVAVLEITKTVRDRYNAFLVASRLKGNKVDDENYLTDLQLSRVDQYRRQLREEKYLEPDEWEFIRKSEAYSRQRRRNRLLTAIAITAGALIILFGSGLYYMKQLESQRLHDQLCEAYQEHAQTLIKSGQYFAALETYGQALLQECDTAFLNLEIANLSDTICGQCSNIVSIGDSLMDEQKFSEALERYTEAKEFAKARAELEQKLDTLLKPEENYFSQLKWCEVVGTPVLIEGRMEAARVNLVEIPRFDTLIARGDFFFNRGTPFHWDALQKYRDAREVAATLQQNTALVNKAQSRIARITSALLREDLRHLTAITQTMEDSDARDRNTYIREVNAKAAAIRQDPLLRIN